MDDDAEILVHWRAGRVIRHIARSLGYARNTVRERIAQATQAGFGQQGPTLTASEWRAALTAAGAGAAALPGSSQLEPLRERIREALAESTAATVWQRLHDAQEIDLGLRTFQRYVRRCIRATDPGRLTVLLPDPAFGEGMELDYGQLGRWTDPLGGRRHTVWAPGASGEARAPGIPGAAARGRDPAPREQVARPPGAAREVRRAADPCRLRLRVQPQDPSAQIRDLATGGFIERKESLLLVGPVGVGKTHLAQAIGHVACQRGRSVLFDKTTRLLADLGAGHLDATWERRLRRYLAPDLLILDDFGLRAFTERQGEDLYELISERVRRGSTIVTSNRPATDWYALFPNAVLAEGELDRLINAAHHITLQGKSYRPQRRPDRATEVTKPKRD